MLHHLIKDYKTATVMSAIDHPVHIDGIASCSISVSRYLEDLITQYFAAEDGLLEITYDEALQILEAEQISHNEEIRESLEEAFK